LNAADRLIVPVGAAVTLGWFLALLDAVITGRPEVFYAANVPFGAVCGGLFARDVIRRGRNGGDR